jgi:tRNA nucleotidyltransferase (CCA-adding enzyme)
MTTSPITSDTGQDPELFMVGGMVRDSILGRPNKDLDIVAICNWDDLVAFCDRQGFPIVDKFMKHLTAKVIVPVGHPWRQFVPNGAVDIACSRVDGPRRDDPAVFEPDIVKDLSRRDFTMNAMARPISLDGTVGGLIDPFGGRDDISECTIEFVGDAMDRIEEDPSRVLRALRFRVQLGFEFGTFTRCAVFSPISAFKLARVPNEVIRDELVKMFIADQRATLHLLGSIAHTTLGTMIFGTGDIKLQPTLAKAIR